MTGFSMSFSPASLAEIAQMYGMGVLLAEETQIALKEVAEMLATAAQAKTWDVFTNPTGELADTIVADVSSPYEAQVRVGSPYGRRRERGFSGMTDALGRFYPYDPAKPYLEPTLMENEQAAMLIVEAAVDTALERMAA